MAKQLLLILSVLVLHSCGWNKSDSKTAMAHERAIREMIDTDKAFSEACKKKGMKSAFLEYSADESVLLRPDHMPIVDAEVIRFLSRQEDTSFTMTWEPKGADLAASNDLGFTYGIYTVTTSESVLKGTYLSIWRMQPDGNWKFILDTGNAGLGQQEQAD